MTRRIAFAVAVAWSVVFLAAGPAWAHANHVSGVAVCRQDGARVVTWTLVNDFNLTEVVSGDFTGSIGKLGTASVDQVIAGTVHGSVSTHVHGVWSDGYSRDDTGVLILPEVSCPVPPPTTTTTTTTAPPVTTTTTAPPTPVTTTTTLPATTTTTGPPLVVTTPTAPKATPSGTPTPEAPHVRCADGQGFTFSAEAVCPQLIPPVTLTELPHTGSNRGLVAVGAALLALGLALRWAFRSNHKEV